MKYLLKMMPLIILALISILLPSCGSEDNPTSAPATASITIDPESVSITTPLGPCDGAVTNFTDNPVTVVVRDSNGSPQNHIAIYLVLDWSPTTSSGFVGARLLDADLNPPVEVSVPYETKTGDHGTKNLLLRLDTGGCSFTGQLTATSGTITGRMEYEVAN